MVVLFASLIAVPPAFAGADPRVACTLVDAARLSAARCSSGGTARLHRAALARQPSSPASRKPIRSGLAWRVLDRDRRRLAAAHRRALQRRPAEFSRSSPASICCTPPMASPAPPSASRCRHAGPARAGSAISAGALTLAGTIGDDADRGGNQLSFSGLRAAAGQLRRPPRRLRRQVRRTRSACPRAPITSSRPMAIPTPSSAPMSGSRLGPGHRTPRMHHRAARVTLEARRLAPAARPSPARPSACSPRAATSSARRSAPSRRRSWPRATTS
jgi:hypothetical protein